MNFKHLLLLVVFTLVFSQEKQSIKQDQLDIITEEELRMNLEFIASDELKGRDTGTDELKIAARYLASRLKAYGFKGLGENGSFLQKVPLMKTSFKTETAGLFYDGKRLDGTFGKDFSIFAWGTESVKVDAEVVSVKSAFFDENEKHYDSADVEGKVAVHFNTDTAKDHRALRNSLFDNKAKAVIWVVEDIKTSERLIPLYKRYISGNNLQLEKESTDERVYVLITKEMFNQVLDEDGEDANKTSIYNFDEKLSIIMKAKKETLYSQNVVAVYEGTDPELKNEYVGFGSHYDHIGMNDKGEIFNGADDDGSGTVGVLNIAKAIAMNPPKRSVFINFHTAEEKGLFGSEYFAENPLIPLEQLVAMINIDMIGSDHKTNTVDVVGADRISQDLHDINEAMNKSTVSMNLDYKYNAKGHPERIYFRSDHYNYAKKGVPIIFYTNDNPHDYHQASDTVDKINFEKLRRITQLALATGYQVANRKDRLKITTLIDKTKKD